MSQASSTATVLSENSSNKTRSLASPLSSDDFVIVCPSRDSGLREAILALYYLPPQFKLRVLMDAVSSKLPFTDHEAVKNRISLETGTSIPRETSSFSRANAVVYSETTPVLSEALTPRVVISKSAQEITQSSDGTTFTISEDSPEALASAILNIAKAAA